MKTPRTSLLRRHSWLLGLALGVGGAATAAAGAARTVHALDIDRIGPAALESLRGDPRVGQFVELGDRALVQAAASFIEEQRAAGRLLGSRALRAAEELRVHRKIHCDSTAEHDARADTFGGDGRWHVTIETVGSDQGKRLDARHEVVAWQAANRPAARQAQAGDDARLAAIAASVDATRWRDSLLALSAYDRQTAAGYNAAAAEVMDRFAKLGLPPQRDCFQSPDGRFNTDGRSCNVQERGSNEDWVIVAAHLDSRNERFDDTLASPGAEDNASGCAGVVEVARVLAGYRTRANILYQCFGLEERGLWGSRAHAPTLTPARVRAVLNLDMIAYDGDGRLDAAIETRIAGRALLDTLAPLAARHTQLEAEFGAETCCSDHVPYLDLGIPAVMLIANDWRGYRHYHTSSDTADQLSDAMAREIVKLAAVGAASIAELSDPALDASGYWYDATRSGQGWHFEALAGERFVATWYTFDASGARLWIVANGTLVDGIAKLQAFTARGGTFPSASAATAAASESWGELRFRFEDCNRGTVEWTPRPETGLTAGSAMIQRLTPARGCAAN